MTKSIQNAVVAGALAVLLAASQTSAQTQSKTIQVGSNCSMTVVTSVISTNLSVGTAGGACTPIDPQAILKALGGNDGSAGGITVSAGAIDPAVITTIINQAAGGKGKAGGAQIDPQAIMKVFAGGGGGLGGGVVTASALTGTNPVTWFGVAADEVSDDLRAQLSLPESAGLIVRNVTKDSPAEKAGVRVNDILVRLDDQLLVNGPQLQALIRGKKEGDKVALTLLRKGKETKLEATLGRKVLSEGGTDAVQVINLGSFGLDLDKAMGQIGTKGGPIVFQKTFTLGGDTNAVSSIDIQAIIKAVTNALDQETVQKVTPAKSK